MSSEREFDFDVLREPWNKYELEDGSYIKSKYVLTKFIKTEPDAQGKAKFGVEGQSLTVVYNAPLSLKGTPSSAKRSSEDIKSSIERELNYKTIQEEWNEYIIEDGTKIRIKDTIARVSRTKLKDARGDPIYYVEHSTLVQGTPPKK